jgi:hypothetical protein
MAFVKYATIDDAYRVFDELVINIRVSFDDCK